MLTLSRLPRLLVPAILILVLPACATSKQVVSTANPGTPVVAFMGGEPGFTTALLANSHGVQSGIFGTALDIASLARETAIDQFVIDQAGNVGTRGHVFSHLDRKPAGGAPLGDAVAALHRAAIEVYADRSPVAAFRGEPPAYIGGNGKSSIDLTTSLAITMAAVNQLSDQVRDLKAQVAALKGTR